MDSIIEKMTEIDAEIDNVIAHISKHNISGDEKIFFDDEELPILVDQIVSKDANGHDEFVLHDEDGNLVTFVLELDNNEENEINENVMCTYTPPVSARSIEKVQTRINNSTDQKDNDSDLSLQISSEESSTEMFSLSTLDDSLSSYLIRTPGRVEISKTSSTTDDREGDSSRSSEFMKYDRDDSWLPDIAESTTTDNTDLDTTAEFIETPEIASTPFAKTPSIPSFKRSGIIKSLFVASDHNYAICNHNNSVLQTSYDSEFYEEGIERIIEEDDEENRNSCQSSTDNLKTKERVKSSKEDLDEIDKVNQESQKRKIVSLSSKESLEEQKQREWEIAVVRLSEVASTLPFKRMDDECKMIDEKESKTAKKEWKFKIDKNEKNSKRKYRLTKVISRKRPNKTAHQGCQNNETFDINDSWNVTINEVKIDNKREIWELSTEESHNCCPGSCSIS